jgi:hypothetical protein
MSETEPTAAVAKQHENTLRFRKSASADQCP